MFAERVVDAIPWRPVLSTVRPIDLSVRGFASSASTPFEPGVTVVVAVLLRAGKIYADMLRVMQLTNILLTHLQVMLRRMYFSEVVG